eukprot:Em0014g594a
MVGTLSPFVERVSMFLDPSWTDADTFTDASGTLGFGAYFDGSWFRGSWLPHQELSQRSIQRQELFAIVAAAHTWGHRLAGCCIRSTAITWQSCTRGMGNPRGTPQSCPASDISRSLDRDLASLVSKALAGSTTATYKVRIQRFITFCRHLDVAAVPSTRRQIALFVTHLSSYLRLPTIRVYLAAVSFLHQASGHRSPHDKLMLQAAMLLAFFGFLRVSEFTTPAVSTSRFLAKGDVKFMNTSLSFRIGVATAAAKAGLQSSTLKELGRWRSAAFHSYPEGFPNYTGLAAKTGPASLLATLATWLVVSGTSWCHHSWGLGNVTQARGILLPLPPVVAKPLGSIKDCRGQSYDNASNMSGKYSGVQARVLEENNKASYIPCMAHSLNLSGVSAAESCVNAVSFFGFVEKLYAFFSASTHRWNLLRTVLSAVNAVERSFLPKRLCETRWSSRSDALKSLSQHYKVYHDVLQQIADDPLQKCDTRSEALAMANIMDTLETVFMTVFWSALLQRIHESSQLLQSTTIEIGSAIAVLKSLLGFLEAQRSLFDDYKARAVAISKTPCFKEVRVRRAKRVFGDSSEPDVVMSSEEKFRIETFYTLYLIVL